MQTKARNRIVWGLAAAAVACAVVGAVIERWDLVAMGVTAVCAWVGLRAAERNSAKRRGSPARTAAGQPVWSPPERTAAPDNADDPALLVASMVQQGRFALLLRPQIAGNLSDAHFQEVLETLTETMSLVPDGEVVVGRLEESVIEEQRLDQSDPSVQGKVVRVEKFFLDRFAVTNRQFYEFVSAGGYQQPAYWDPSILPAVLDFVDLTGTPGPRFWRHGCFDPALEDHPVVGVSWYEAAAYARWVGKRLPTDAEWVKAGAWPMSLTAGSPRSQRRYPWGDTMDRRKANLWTPAAGGTTPVGAIREGVSVGGVYQLIGNVWEWTRGNFNPPGSSDGRWLIDTPLRSIRGGAFDTYFDGQATCQFASGESPVARKHNIGFRCAVGVCDLVLSRAAPAESADEAAASEDPVEIGV